MSFSLKVINNLKANFSYKNYCKRFVSVSSSFNKNVLQRLENRGLVRVTGDEVVPYLQGLITNDMRHLEDGAGSMYTMFLNTKGRVVYDSIIYRTEDPKAFLIECDNTVINLFQKHLKMFKVKRKVDIEEYSHKVWVLFDKENVNCVDYIKGDSELKSMSNSNPSPKFDSKENMLIYKDPRVNLLGTRILCNPSVSSETISKIMNISEVEKNDQDLYRIYRYHLGVAEGVHDLPPGNCFPLEANADYLHGVSFQKGCYIGQELTARTHHTGVVRKRLMPLLFEKKLDGEIPNDTSIYGPKDSKTSIGKVRGVTEQTGLGLLRVNQALQAAQLSISGNNVKTYRPKWWPAEASKEKTPPSGQ